jgi:hypothetical protein
VFAFQIASHLEGFFGIASAFMMGGFAFFLIAGFAFVVAAIFKPVLAISRFTRTRSVTLFWVQSLGFTAVVFFSWMIPYPSALVGDWKTYNERTLIFFWGVTLNFVVFLTIPFFLVVRMFNGAVKSTITNVARLSSGPHEVENNKHMEDLVKSIVSLRNHVANQTIPLGIIALYNTITVLAYNQVALQPLIFFIFLMSPVTFSLGVAIFLYHNGQRGQKSSDSKHSSKNDLAVVPALGGSSKNTMASESLLIRSSRE